MQETKFTKDELDNLLNLVIATSLAVHPGTIAVELNYVLDILLALDGGVYEDKMDEEGNVVPDSEELVACGHNGVLSGLVQHYEYNVSGCSVENCFECALRYWFMMHGRVMVDVELTSTYTEMLETIEDEEQLEALNAIEYWVLKEDVDAVVTEGL